MKVLDIAEIKLQWVDVTNLTQHAWAPYEIPPNTMGATTIIKYIAMQLGKFTKDDEQDTVGLRVLIGMGWEAMCAQLYPNMWWQPNVLSLDGICGHPDGFSEVSVPYQEPCIDEFKYTAKSIRVPGGSADQLKSIADEWMWQCQMMAYLKMHPAEPVYGQFHVCWAMNNYTKHTLDEKYYRYLVKYDRDEIERNWKMLMDHKDDLKVRYVK